MSLKSTHQTCRHTHVRLVVSASLAVTAAPASQLLLRLLEQTQAPWETSSSTFPNGHGQPGALGALPLPSWPRSPPRLCATGGSPRWELRMVGTTTSAAGSSLPFLPNYILVEHSFFSGPPSTETPGSPRRALVIRSMLVSQGTIWPLQPALSKNESSTFSFSLAPCIFSHKACPEG